jgi:hypothetical protein
METFGTEADERRYLEWLRAHPRGYVFNTNKGNAREEGTRLHAATCRSISQLREGYRHFKGGAYQKLCSDDRRELESWSQRTFGFPVKACTNCLG